MSLRVTLADIGLSRFGGARERKRVMRAYALGRADHRRGRDWRGEDWGRNAVYRGNFNAPLRHAYNAGWYSVR